MGITDPAHPLFGRRFRLIAVTRRCSRAATRAYHTARRTLAGYEAMAMVRKGQVRKVGGRDMRAQAGFIAKLFEVAA